MYIKLTHANFFNIKSHTIYRRVVDNSGFSSIFFLLLHPSKKNKAKPKMLFNQNLKVVKCIHNSEWIILTLPWVFNSYITVNKWSWHFPEYSIHTQQWMNDLNTSLGIQQRVIQPIGYRYRQHTRDVITYSFIIHVYAWTKRVNLGLILIHDSDWLIWPLPSIINTSYKSPYKIYVYK